MGMFGRFRPRGGDGSTMARGDSSRLVPSAGGMGRPPGPPFRTTVGFMGPDNPGNFGPPPRDGNGGRGYGDLPKRPNRGAKDPGGLPKRPNINQPQLPSKQTQASTWGDPPKKDAPTKETPKKKPSENAPEAPKKISSYHANTAPYQTTDEWASSVARRKGWIPD